MSAGRNVLVQVHDMAFTHPYLQYVHDTRDTDDTLGRRLATLIKGARLEREWTQEQLEDASGVSRQTIIRYESGKAAAPKPDELRRVCAALGLDLRDVVVALGYVTREELGLPPQPATVPQILRDIARTLNAPQIAETSKQSLLDMIGTVYGFWQNQLGLRPDVKEPSAAKRSAGRAVL